MSWSFSVNAPNKEDAEREFDNKLAENEVQIPNSIGNALSSAARGLMYNAKSNQPCTVSTNGHINADGTGSVDIRVLVARAVETLPLPGDKAVDGGAVKPSTLDASDGGRLG